MEIRMNELKIITMQHQTDCEVAAIATATGKSWGEARDALSWEPLNYGLENPVFGNPYNLYRALLKLGFWKRNINLNHMLNGDYKPLETIVLLHDERNPLLYQHWAVLGKYDDKVGVYDVYYGHDKKPVYINKTQLQNMFLKGFPNCAFQVYRANPIRLVIQKTLGLFSKIRLIKRR